VSRARDELKALGEGNNSDLKRHWRRKRLDGMANTAGVMNGGEWHVGGVGRLRWPG